MANDRVDAILSSVAELTADELVALRERLGPLCLWCGAAADRLCDMPIMRSGPDREGCDAPVCSRCSTSTSIRGHLCGSFGGELLDDTIDRCPYCAGRIACKVRPLARAEHDAAAREHAAKVKR